MSRLRSFGRDNGGQISFLMVFGAVALVGLLGLVMTTGDQTAQKIRMQNTADAAALSGGAWIARGLNLTSAINVVQTQLVGGAILLNALADSLDQSRYWVLAQCEGYTACIGVFPGCVILATITCAQHQVLGPLANTVSRVANSLSRCPSGLFWTVARVLEGLNTGIHLSFFAIAAFEAYDTAKSNGAELAVFLPGPLVHGKLSWKLLTLPTRKAGFPALCPPMEEGSPAPGERGYSPLLHYPVGQGPYRLGKCRLSWVAGLVTGFPPIGHLLFSRSADQQKNALCGSGASGAGGTRPATSLEECRSLDGEARWRKTTLDIGELWPTRDGCGWLLNHIGGGVTDYDSLPDSKVTREEIVKKSCSFTPPGREIDLHTYCRTTFPHHAHVPGQMDRLTEPPQFLNTVEIWTLEETSVEDKAPIDPQPSSGNCNVPSPYLLAPENDGLRFLAVARKRNRSIFFGAGFLEPPPDLYTYAQVEVYNGVSDDTFTQDWRVHLSPAALVESPLSQVDVRLPDGTPAQVFGPRSPLISGVWEINNH